MRNRTFYFTLLLVSVAFGLSGCGLDNNDNTGTPPPNIPPVANPPPVEPPSDEDPSTETPPAEEPPLEEPPAEQPPVEDSPAEEPVPEEPVGALTLDPEIAAKGVAPNGDIALVSDRPLNATSVSTSIELRDAGTTETVPSSVTYEAATQSITITPTGTFDAEKHYAVHVKGARDTNGNAVEVSGQSVTRVKQRVYSRTTLYNEEGTAPDFASHYSRVPGSNEALRIYYNGPGQDGVWHEGEDDISSYEKTLYLPDNVETVFIFNGPGEGEVWFDDNDVVERAWRYRYMPDGRVMERLQTENAGEDGEYFTSDDHYRVGEFKAYDESERHVLSLYRSVSFPEERRLNPGADGKWLTGDDGGFIYYRYQHDTDGRLTRKTAFSSVHPGLDDIAFNGDDRVLNYTDFLYDDTGRLAETHSYFDAGPNQVWFDEDDDASSLEKHVRTDTFARKEFWNAGADDRANTNDDWLSSYHYREYDELGRLSRTGTYDWKGSDGVWHTADDEPFSWADVYEYGVDECGQPQLKVFSLEDNGLDGKRFTGDEEIVAKWALTYDQTSQLAHSRTYFEPGLLPGWEDGDEVLNGEVEYLEIEE